MGYDLVLTADGEDADRVRMRTGPVQQRASSHATSQLKQEAGRRKLTLRAEAVKARRWILEAANMLTVVCVE